MKKVVKIFLVIILCGMVGVVSYFGTLKLDQQKKGGDVSITVTFEDTEEYQIPSAKKMKKEDALKEWPYIFRINNSESGKALYQIIISETDKSTIKRDSLKYSLYLDDKEISEGKLKDLQKDILYTGSIEGEKEQTYKLYIWTEEELDEGVYEYKLSFNTIKDGGPGF